MISHLIVFGSALLAATLLPISSEIVLVSTLSHEPQSWFSLWVVASIGNTLGSTCNWALGRYFLRYEEKRWFPFSPDKLHRAQHWFQRYGYWSLLLAWIPLVGDGLTFIAGTLHVPFRHFWPLVLCGKAARYAVIIYLTLHAAS